MCEIRTFSFYIQTPPFVKLFPKINDTRKRIIKMKNKILAIEAAPEAIPPKPNTAAIIATTKKMTVQRNIIVDFKFLKFV